MSKTPGGGKGKGILQSLPRKRGLHIGNSREPRPEPLEIVDEMLERWEPLQTKDRCFECGDPLVEYLNEYSLITTRRCKAGHRSLTIKIDA